MSDESHPPNTEPAAGSRAAATAVDITGGLIGLVVFLAGVALLVQVFFWAHEVYQSIDTGIAVAQVSSPPHSSATKAQSPAGRPVQAEDEPGPVVAHPGGKPLSMVAAALALKLLGLLVLGAVATLIAGRGAALAGAHRGKRT